VDGSHRNVNGYFAIIWTRTICGVVTDEFIDYNYNQVKLIVIS
jgi:hypothetical protein